MVTASLFAFSAFASTYERLAGVTYPSDKGNYIMTAKDGANCKKLVTWLKKVSASEQAPEDMVAMFTTAAWQISDKWLKSLQRKLLPKALKKS